MVVKGNASNSLIIAISDRRKAKGAVSVRARRSIWLEKKISLILACCETFMCLY